MDPALKAKSKAVKDANAIVSATEPPSRLEAPDTWRIVVCVRGSGEAVAKRQAERMSEEDQSRLREAFQSQTNVRAVLQSILDAQADAAATVKAVKASEAS